MDAAQLNAAGYKVSTLLADDVVSRFETMVRNNYVLKVLPNPQPNDPAVEAAAMQLVVIALSLDNVHVTRAGAKVKSSPALSERAYNATQMDYENANLLLRALQSQTGAVQGRLDGIVNDVLHIYFRSYLSMN